MTPDPPPSADEYRRLVTVIALKDLIQIANDTAWPQGSDDEQELRDLLWNYYSGQFPDRTSNDLFPHFEP